MKNKLRILHKHIRISMHKEITFYVLQNIHNLLQYCDLPSYSLEGSTKKLMIYYWNLDKIKKIYLRWYLETGLIYSRPLPLSQIKLWKYINNNNKSKPTYRQPHQQKYSCFLILKRETIFTVLPISVRFL